MGRWSQKAQQDLKTGNVSITREITNEFMQYGANIVSFFLLFNGALLLLEVFIKRKEYRKFAQDAARYRKVILQSKREGDYEKYYGTLLSFNSHLYRLDHIGQQQYKKQEIEFVVVRKLSRKVGRLITVEEASDDDKIAIRNAMQFNKTMWIMLKAIMGILASYGIFKYAKRYNRKAESRRKKTNNKRKKK